MSENIFEEFAIKPDARLTPEEIEGKDFVVSLRGFDQNDVREYMRRLAASYRSALQDSQLAALALEDAKQEALVIDEKARHADMQLDDARSMREESSRELEQAQALCDQAARQRDEAEAALQMIKDRQAEMSSVASGDPYDHASQQIASVLRAADDAASDVRREAQEVAAAIRLDSEKMIADAKKLSVEIEADARKRGDEHLARVTAASQKCAQVMNTMQLLEAQVQTAAAAAMEELLASTQFGDIIPLDPAASTELAS